MDLKQTENEELRMLHNAEEQGRLKERAKWEAQQAANQPTTTPESENRPKWVRTSEAKKIVERKDTATLKKWVEQGLINPPKKIGRPLYWEVASLLKMSPNGK